MGSVVVDQIGSEGTLLEDFDTTLTSRQKNDLLLAALPGATVGIYGGEQVVLFHDQVIMRKQVTYLGIPWEPFKKRIQIPKKWLEVHRQALEDGLTPRFVGIYHYRDVTIFVDFDPSTYVLRKANNSAAHVSTNDLYQAQTSGLFSRVDGRGNALTSVRFDLLADYLLDRVREANPYLDVLADFNAEFLTDGRLEALDAVREMHAAAWPDTMQGEWAGFYLEYRLDEFLRRSGAHQLVAFQKAKRRGQLDYDLVFNDRLKVAHYGDLKASNMAEHESPGNAADDIRRCVAEYGRFWYIIYEHETWHSRDDGDLPVIDWNEWRRSVGHVGRKAYDPLSYARRFKSAVRFERMMILEVNEANFHVVLGDFNQGRQPDGAARALKVMITKRNIDNFLIFSASVD
ncbi:hypothetical protein GCM10009867_21830 [Pedococcus aerophilus]|uniref:Methylase-associated X1 domain-containing protein n=1 Tax=Pedococcus aerophilus TaxID=436356 RepID=A0ABN3UPC9_9MICO